MSNKNSDKDYLSVKEFAGLVGMSADTLRQYDNKGIFHPAKHGIEFENKYRYYAPTQITTVKMIRVLAEIGVPLQTIRELATSRTPEKLMKLLSKHKNIIADEMRFLQDVFSVVSTFLELLSNGMSATEQEIFISEMPEKQIVLGDINDFDGSVGFYREFTRFCNMPHEPKLNLSYPVGGYFDSMDVFLNEPAQPTRFFSLDPTGNDRKAAGMYLTGYTRGYYGRTNDLPQRMARFAKRNSVLFNGPVYNIYLFDEMSVTDPDRYLLQVSASVKEIRRAPSRRPLRRL
jgi:DNA-binding transcriptional MerR regulator